MEKNITLTKNETFCNVCQTVIQQKAQYCHKCGTRNSSFKKKIEKKKNNRQYLRLYFYSIICLVLTISGVTFYSYYQNNQFATNQIIASEYTIVLSKMYNIMLQCKKEYGTYDLDPTSLGLFEDPNSDYFIYKFENCSEHTFTISATVFDSFGDVKVGSKATLNHNGEKRADSDLQKYVPYW